MKRISTLKNKSMKSLRAVELLQTCSSITGMYWEHRWAQHHGYTWDKLSVSHREEPKGHNRQYLFSDIVFTMVLFGRETEVSTGIMYHQTASQFLPSGSGNSELWICNFCIFVLYIVINYMYAHSCVFIVLSLAIIMYLLIPYVLFLCLF